MKKTMTKEEFVDLWLKEDSDGRLIITKDGFMLYDLLSEAGISFDIYYDSDGQIIKPGDEGEFFNRRCIFYGVSNDGFYLTDIGFAKTFEKNPTEKWEPVPMEDLIFVGDNWDVNNPQKWAKKRTHNGKPEGVRVKKDGVTKDELDKLRKVVTGE